MGPRSPKRLGTAGLLRVGESPAVAPAGGSKNLPDSSGQHVNTVRYWSRLVVWAAVKGTVSAIAHPDNGFSRYSLTAFSFSKAAPTV